jgi:hypothetical protein
VGITDLAMVLFLVLAFALAVSIYLAPAIIAIRANHPNKTAIVVLNILGGWTFIVWVVALVWALTQTEHNPAVDAVNHRQPTTINVVQQSQMHTTNSSGQTQPHYANGQQLNSNVAGVPKIIGISGLFAGQYYDLRQGAVTIGRDPSVSQLAYPSTSGSISRRHCQVYFEENSRRFIVTDTSTNGTYIYPQQRLIQGQPVYLEPGTRFFLSDPSEQYELSIM